MDIETQFEQYIQERAENRKKYFEKTRYHKLSDITEIGSYYYNRYTDSCVIRSIIAGKLTNWNRDLNIIMNEHKDDPKVNWQAIYDYIDQQIKKVPANEKQLIKDLNDINEQLKPYRKQLLPVYTGF